MRKKNQHQNSHELLICVRICIYGWASKQGDDEGVFISRVTPGGPADLAGLRVHDKVLSVNGISCVNVDHYEAVGILKVDDYDLSISKIMKGIEMAKSCILLSSNG